jgi:hypothetical protein
MQGNIFEALKNIFETLKTFLKRLKNIFETLKTFLKRLKNSFETFKNSFDVRKTDYSSAQNNFADRTEEKKCKKVKKRKNLDAAKNKPTSFLTAGMNNVNTVR